VLQNLCENCFQGTHTCAKFHTNIDSIKFQLYEARNKPVVNKVILKPKPIIKPQVITPKVVSKVVVSTPSKIVGKNKPFLRIADNQTKFDDFYEDWNDYDEDI
jgi:hypothetical protein